MVFAAAALAEPEKRIEIRLATDTDGAHEATEIRLSGAEMDFDLHDMQIGENRSVVDESGRTILITRQEDGYDFNVDGKTIEVPSLHGDYSTWVSNDMTDVDVEVHATGAHQMMMMGDDADGIFIISGKPLDASTQASIRAVLQSAGHDTEVQFIDGGHTSGERHVKVIKKTVTQ